MLRFLKLHLMRCCHWLAHATRLYWLWSCIYQLIYHREYKHIELYNLSPDQAWHKVKVLTWREDGWRELRDVVGSPMYVQYCINEVSSGNEQPAGSLDCDDFAIWCANSINNDFEPYYFTTSWLKVDGSVSGHAVCLFYRGSNPKSLYHIGNWGMRGPFSSLQDISKKMATLAGGVEIIGWSVYTRSLKLIDFGNGMPPVDNLIDRS